MATNHTLIVTLVGITLLIAVATSYETSSTTGELPFKRCREQIEDQHQLSDCNSYLSSTSPSTPQTNKHLHGCCKQITSLEARCHCAALKQLVYPQRTDQRVRNIQNLPAKCKFPVPPSCPIP